MYLPCDGFYSGNLLPYVLYTYQNGRKTLRPYNVSFQFLT